MSPHVLVAEDSATQAYVLRGQLEDAGYRVTVATDGGTALREVESGPIDAVVSDVVMPGLDGYQLCRRLKSAPATATIPVMLLTTLRDPLDVVRALEAGADGFLTKPAPAEQIVGRLAALLETRGRRATAEPGPVLDVLFMGHRIGVSSDRQQVVDVLMSSFEELIRTNAVLREREAELATAKDALELHLDEAEQARRRLDRSLGLSGVGAFEFDLATRTVLWSEHVAPLYGLADASFGPDDRELLRRVHPEDRRRVRELLASAADRDDAREHGTVEEFEYRVVHPDGQVRWLRLRFAVTAERRLLGVALDVTEERELHGELAEARDDAERANRAKTDFLARMSHELRTPLNAILGFGEVLAGSTGLATEDRTGVGHIVDAGRHLLQLIDEVLDISRIESGNVDVAAVAVEVSEVVDRSVHMLRGAADDARVTVTVRTTEAVSITADRRRLQQVVLNLVSNAIKYNRPGGQVEIRWRRTEDGLVALAIEDTGVGIPAAQRERLFVPFDRLGAEGSDIEGTGLGLALTVRLVDLMGGRLEVASEVGVGSTFTVLLPLAGEQPSSGVEVTASSPSAERGPDASTRGTVVHIEDRAANRELLHRILRRRPEIELLDAPDGATGADLVRRRQPDLVLLDLQLPDRSGRDVLAELRRDPATSRTPVVVLSGDASPARSAELRELGADGFLSKPFDIAALLEVIDAMLHPRRSPPGDDDPGTT